MQEEQLFHQALEHPPDRRGAFLDAACGGDAGLRARVEVLLRACEHPGSFLQSPVAAAYSPTITDRPITETPGTVIGPYKLLEQIGEGGFGIVFMAEQTAPVKRKVALKVIKPGMDTRQVIARFEAERQALALMDHPNIAKVLDAGATETGRPYFVMELVRGVPITSYCDEHLLSPRERLKLFLDVCHAVQHAHQKGIIHRDIKPTNVLVTQHDDKPVVKVIDFGVAKATSGQLTDKTLFTGFAQLVGTPLYMSPEQASMSGIDVDTRSDIYSLGVLLYELLTGTTPFDKSRLQQAAFDEVRRIIREEEPQKPSTRLSELSRSSLPGWTDRKLDAPDHTGPARQAGPTSLASIAALRKTEPRKLSQLVKGDLDWIVMKALEKDRGRRYETANGFAADVLRYLADEPVTACPPSAGHRFRKFARRNRVAIATGAIVALSLVIGSGVATWQAVRATHERDRAMTAERAATESAAVATAINDFIKDDLLALANPMLEPDRQITLRAVVDRAAASVGDRFASQPLVEAGIRETLGNTYQGLGDDEESLWQFQRAAEIYRQVHGDDHRRTRVATFHAAAALQQLGRYAEAESLLASLLQVERRLLGAEHDDTLHTMIQLAWCREMELQFEPAEPLYAEALAILRRTRGESHPLTLYAKSAIAVLYNKTDRLDAAEPLFREVLTTRRTTLGNEHPLTLQSAGHLGSLLLQKQDYAGAEPLLAKSLETQRRVLTESHASTIESIVQMAHLYALTGRPDDAELLLREALELARRHRGEDHPVTLRYQSSLAAHLINRDRHAEAEAPLQRVVEVGRRIWGEERAETLEAMHRLGLVERKLGMLVEAEDLFATALDRRRSTLGDEHADTLESMHALASLYHDQGRLAEAVEIYLQELEILRRVRGGEHPHTLTTMNDLGVAYEQLGRYADAEPLFREVLAVRRRRLGDTDPATLATIHNLAFVCREQRKFTDAEPLFCESLDGRKRVLGENSPDTLLTMHQLALLYCVMDRVAEAEALFLETLPRLRSVQGEDGPGVLEVLRVLAVMYQDQGRFVDAQQQLDALLPMLRRKVAPDSVPWAATLALAGKNLLELGRFTEAEDYLRDCVAVREQKQPGSWQMEYARAMLGAALLGQHRFSDAEPLLTQGYDGLARMRDEIPQKVRAERLSWTLARIIALYEQRQGDGDAEKRQKYKTLLDGVPPDG
jgi:serine/threonine protein kinase/tetratricopeptide (TPR) repeat protein